MSHGVYRSSCDGDTEATTRQTVSSRNTFLTLEKSLARHMQSEGGEGATSFGIRVADPWRTLAFESRVPGSNGRAYCGCRRVFMVLGALFVRGGVRYRDVECIANIGTHWRRLAEHNWSVV